MILHPETLKPVAFQASRKNQEFISGPTAKKYRRSKRRTRKQRWPMYYNKKLHSYGPTHITLYVCACACAYVYINICSLCRSVVFLILSIYINNLKSYTYSYSVLHYFLKQGMVRVCMRKGNKIWGGNDGRV